MADISEELAQAFQILDKDQSGSLTKAELIPVLNEVLGSDSTAIADDIMSKADKDGSGTINSICELDEALKATGILRLKRIYNEHDTDGNKALTKEELAPLLQKALGFPPGQFTDEIMQIADKNNSGTIDSIAELQHALKEADLIKGLVLMEAFRVIDAKGSADGYITADDLKKHCETFDPEMRAQVEDAFKSMETSGDGKISLEEFMKAMLGR